MILAEKYQPVLNDRSYSKFTKNSIDYTAWWEEQKLRCRNGYKPTGGSWIPGPYYFYINFCKIERFNEATGRKTVAPPSYRDQDHEYFLEVDLAKKGNYGLIVGKARRKGFSFNNMGLALHEYTFYPGTHIGIGSEVESYVQDFRARTTEAYFGLPTEFRLKYLLNNTDKLVSGYKVKTKQGFVDKGTKSVMHWRAMDPTGKKSAFRGLSLSQCYFEEFGEWKAGKQHYFSTEECFREGNLQFGIPIIGGTSNQIKNDSPDYMEMFNNAEKYNLKALFIPASKVYHGFFDYKTGQSEVVGASADIEQRAVEKLKESKNAYYSFRQEMPLVVEHMFMQSAITPFDLDKINQQIADLTVNKKLNIAQKCRLEWPEGPEGKRIFGAKPLLIYDDHGDCSVVEIPITGFKNLDVAAVDPYHINDAFEEKGKIARKKRGSIGCMYVYRRFANISIPGEMPIFEYIGRPETKEDFYEVCLKICLLYDCQVLVEYNDSGFLEYFQRHNMMRYLKERPRSADAPYSQVTNRYGIHMKDYQKRLAVEKITDYIKKHCEDIYFLELLLEFLDFGKKNTDRVMAFGMSLIFAEDVTQLVSEISKVPDKMFIPHFKRDEKGNVVSVNTKEKNNKFVFNVKLPK